MKEDNKLYMVIFESMCSRRQKGNELKNEYIEIETIKHVIEIRELNSKNNYVINNIIKTNNIDNLDIDYKIKINEYSFTTIDNNLKYIDEVFSNYVIGTKSELKFHSQEMLNNKLNSIKIVYEIFNKDISIIEEIVKEKISQIIKKIIFDDIINEEDLIYL